MKKLLLLLCLMGCGVDPNSPDGVIAAQDCKSVQSLSGFYNGCFYGEAFQKAFICDKNGFQLLGVVCAVWPNSYVVRWR